LDNIARDLIYLPALLSSIALVHPKDGRVSALLYLPKVVIGACMPALALVGSAVTLIGIACGDAVVGCGGLLGAAVAVWYVTRVTAPHDGFGRAFGPGWQSRIPATLQARMPRRRWPIIGRVSGIRLKQDAAFGTHVETGDALLADIWQPPPGVPPTGLAVVYLHGGGWHYLHKGMGTRRLFGHLAGQGHVVMDVGYTKAPVARLRAMVADVHRAIAWLKLHATEYGVDPERIVTMGCSSGAHLALLAAYAHDHPQLRPADVNGDTSVRAVVSYCGHTDLIASYDYFETQYKRLLSGQTPVERAVIAALERVLHRTDLLPPGGHYVDPVDLLPSLMGGTPDEVPELYRLGSPIHHAGPHCPPTLLLQGAHDYTGIVPDVKRLHRALREAGATSIHVEFPYTEHAFDSNIPRSGPAAQAATHDVDRFLALMV